MAIMGMQARKEYRGVVRERYWKARSKKEKTQILDEYCANTGQARKYAIRKLRAREDCEHKPRKKRKPVYDGEVTAALARIWEIFDYPCGQRLKPLVERETDRLRDFGELSISDEVAAKLKRMSAATIDRKLKHQKEVLHLLWSRGGHKPGSALSQKIAIRLTDWDTAKVGYIEADLVFHCGASTLGEHVCTVSATEISSGWWEGEPIMGKSQDRCSRALREIRQRCPFAWKGLDCDNGGEFINEMLYKYCAREKLEFTRSRPGHKNDNAYIEEKNWTHVRKVLGYLRYDTVEEIVIIRDLYRHELRQYKNFFQPVMKLQSKERIGGRIKRKYGTPMTPYQNLMESKQLGEEAEEHLRFPSSMRRFSSSTRYTSSYSFSQRRGLGTSASASNFARTRRWSASLRRLAKRKRQHVVDVIKAQYAGIQVSLLSTQPSGPVRSGLLRRPDLTRSSYWTTLPNGIDEAAMDGSHQ